MKSRAMWAALVGLCLTTGCDKCKGDNRPPTFTIESYEAQQRMSQDALARLMAEVPPTAPPKPTTFECPITSVPAGITKEDLESWLRMMSEFATDQASFDLLCAQLKLSVDEAIQHSADNIPPPDPTAAWVWVKVRSKHKVKVGEGGVKVAQLEEKFPCGAGPSWTTVCASTAPFKEEDYFVVTMVMQDDLRFSDAEHHHQFSVGFDSNGDPSDNYLASASFPNDFWDGLDVVYEIADEPNQDPTFSAIDLRNGAFEPLSSAARVAYSGDTLIAIIPASELSSTCPGHRVTSFTHLGDYGLEPPNFWAGDTEPVVHEALEPVCEEV